MRIYRGFQWSFLNNAPRFYCGELNAVMKICSQYQNISGVLYLYFAVGFVMPTFAFR